MTVQAYKVGICSASVCASNDESPEAVADAVNREHPTGISSRWEISDDATFATGEPNPCPCNTQPETHSHYLLIC